MKKRSPQFQALDLPKGERLIWQGRPGAWSLAIRVFHIRLVACYFALLFLARIAADGLRPADMLAVASRLAVPFALAMILLAALAVIYSRTTRYSITNQRVLLQFGAVLPMTLNVPFRQVASAALKEYSDGSGDLPLSVVSEQRLAFLLLWPHVRPWKLNHVEPMLRCVPNARDVAALLSEAAETSPQSPEPVVPAMPVPWPASTPPAVASAA